MQTHIQSLALKAGLRACLITPPVVSVTTLEGGTGLHSGIMKTSARTTPMPRHLPRVLCVPLMYRRIVSSVPKCLKGNSQVYPLEKLDPVSCSSFKFPG